jgi:plasmid stabilization system protein ParE
VKQVALQPLARQDIFDAIDNYRTDAPHVVDRFVDEVERVLASIGRSPRLGSPALADALDLPGLRVRGLRTFPHLVFYTELTDSVCVLRFLHHSRGDVRLLLDEE